MAYGTRAVIGVVFGPSTVGELEYASRLVGDLRAGMLLLGDRNFALVLGRLGLSSIGMGNAGTAFSALNKRSWVAAGVSA